MTLPAESESAFQAKVINLAQYGGWRYYHAPDNRPIKTATGRVRKQHVVPGFPDLILLRNHEHLAVELKTDKGRVSLEQAAWLQAFGEAGVEIYIWRPRDFDEVVRPRLLRPALERAA